MFKLVVGILSLAVIVLAAILFVQKDPGFVLVKYGDFSVETSLAFGIIAVAIAALLIHFIFRVLMSIWNLPGAVKRQSKSRRYDKSRRSLNQGLIDLAEGRFDQAESNLVKLVEYSESPLVHYLAAARAAQLQGKHDERDSYLKAAHEARPEAGMAIGVTQAELQLAHQQLEQSLATLTHLRGIAPRHNHVLRLLARVYFELEDWQSLVELLPDIRKKKLLKESILKNMEGKSYRGFLAAAKGNQQALEKAWAKIPKASQTDADLILYYIKLSNRASSNSSSVEQLIIKSLDQKWDNRLVEAYGLFKAIDPNQQLRRTEKWLGDYAKNEYLLLALGRICIRARLWGKAQSYLEASIGVNAMAASCLVLAKLLGDQLQENDKASQYYKKGLQLCLSEEAEISDSSMTSG
ncbi:MAG: heme biosynthesis protein HemY [Gammaproteobacteria bacterium]|nr:MAG: heme biosynthesis protein HemY [Gammaproteobacteria bacterium]